MTRLTPPANPLIERWGAEVGVPRNSVRSAFAGRGVRQTSDKAARIAKRIRVVCGVSGMCHDNAARGVRTVALPSVADHMDLSQLASGVAAGDVRALARGISLIENDPRNGAGLVRDLFGRTGRAFVIGLTGAPGAGKSTLVDGLVKRWRGAGKSVGVIAVDPTS